MKNVEEQKPLVSIWCMAYNHIDYIRDAIEGFLMQQTTFPYEIIIHDDASTDGTTEIIKEYQEKYPHLIKAIYRKENIYHKPNRMELLTATKMQFLSGKYVAYCEGDDYWIDPHKLQKQVDYMEANAECMMTVHNADRIDFSTNETYAMNPFSESGILSAEQIIMQRNGILPTASYVIRKECTLLKGIFTECGIGDWPTQLYALTKGYIYYFDEVMSVYRFMHSTSWSKKTISIGKENLCHCMKMIVFLLKYNRYTNRKYEIWILARMHRFIKTLSEIYKELGSETYNDIFEEEKALFGVMENRYLSTIDEIAKRASHINFENPEVIAYCKTHEPIVIWGAGQYAEKYAKALIEQGIEITGFLVSKRTDGQDIFMGKRLWDLDDFPYAYEDVNILVAVSFFVWPEIMVTLDRLGIEKYYSPFMMDKENFVMARKDDIVIYGAGACYKGIKGMLASLYNIKYICDRRFENEAEQKTYDGIPVIKKEDIKHLDNCLLIICIADKAIQEELRKEFQIDGVECKSYMEVLNLGQIQPMGYDELKEKVKDGKYIDRFNNRIEFEGDIPENIRINFIGVDNYVYIGKNVIAYEKLVVRCGTRARVTIGDCCTLCNVDINASWESIEIGEDCMFSFGVFLRNVDDHHIYSTKDGQRINWARPIQIGNHVWVGKNVTLLKGFHIGQDSIIGANTVTSSEFPSNVIIAGNPARVIREDVTWERDVTFTYDYPTMYR